MPDLPRGLSHLFAIALPLTLSFGQNGLGPEDQYEG